MSRHKPNLWLGFATVLGLVYPTLIYFFHALVPNIAWIFLALALIGIRLLFLRNQQDMRLWRGAFLFSAAGLVILAFLNPSLAAEAYPVFISLSVGAVFGLSLIWPPTIIERFAQRHDKSLDMKGIRYTRYVTWVWFIFLMINAIIAATLAVWGTTAQWTLWTGFISYLLMGLLFGGEYLVRQKVLR